MQIIIDATAQDKYPVGKDGFYGGTELMIHELAKGLAKTHVVHVVTYDLDMMEQRGEKLFYWPRAGHPDGADAVVMIHDLANLAPYSAKTLIWASNGLGADLGPDDEFLTGVDAVACFSECHKNLLCHQHPKTPRDKCHVTGLGVGLEGYTAHPIKKPGRLLYANAPERGLLNTLKVFQLIQKEIPDASLHISYDWGRVFNIHRYAASALADSLWECKALIETIPNVVDLGPLTRSQVIQEQLECQLHLYPSSPPNIGSQIHGITQMECAAAGCALILSDFEAFPEVFGEAAEILPLPGTLDPHTETRWGVDDWAELAVELMKNPDAWGKLSGRSRALAEKNTWDHVVTRWNKMLAEIA